jgi:hypothetical protein
MTQAEMWRVSYLAQDEDGRVRMIKELPASATYYWRIELDRNDVDGIWEFNDRSGVAIQEVGFKEGKDAAPVHPVVFPPPE